MKDIKSIILLLVFALDFFFKYFGKNVKRVFEFPPGSANSVIQWHCVHHATPQVAHPKTSRRKERGKRRVEGKCNSSCPLSGSAPSGFGVSPSRPWEVGSHFSASMDLPDGWSDSRDSFTAKMGLDSDNSTVTNLPALPRPKLFLEVLIVLMCLGAVTGVSVCTREVVIATS